MQEKRRSFIKKTLGASAVLAVGGVKAVASEQPITSNGVVIGKSPKKEILYKKTQHWEAYYKRAY